MPFNSISFSIFFIVILAVSFVIKRRFRWIILFLASLYFYSILNIYYLALLILCTLLDFGIALYMDSRKKPGIRKTALVISLAINIGLLFGFKYLIFFDSLLSLVLQTAWLNLSVPHLNIIVPVGISFFTFKKMSYVIDVYRGTIEVERNPLHFFLYVGFFLEILSGPIDRASNLIRQLKNPEIFNPEEASTGFLLILWGVFLKVVVADRLAIYTDAIFNNVGHHYGPSLVLAAYFYTFQIYCDFAGYTNIALGCGRLLGLKLMTNFNLPYFSKSIGDFWRRWHMSLSFWFRDYLYIPLGGNRVSDFRRCLNFMIVFLLCGLWHGANLTFVIWGGLHGLYQSIGFLSKKTRERVVNSIKLPKSFQSVIQILITFHLAVFAWIFFRANSIGDVATFFKNLSLGWPVPFLDLNSMAYGLAGIIIVSVVDFMKFREKLSLEHCMAMPVWVRWAIYYSLIFSIILCGVDGESAFIYAQF
jgi:alginate O-acetyltransferase complex protein AlgI